MKMKRILTWALALACIGAGAHAETTAETILAMERRAMDGWHQGNPDAFIAISDPGITFFHSAVPGRLEGLEAVKALYESYRGRPLFDSYEIVDPKVAVWEGTAVLTYQLTTQNGSLTRHWGATEVYRKGDAGWRIVHSHFSQVNP
jgi:hypothetical protein